MWTLIQSGSLTVMYLSPLEVDVNEQIIRVREALRAHQVVRLALDPLSNYEDVLPAVEYRDNIFALISFVKSSGVTAPFTTEIRELTAVERITSFGTSYLVDNIILLRFVELANELRRAVVVLKTRGSDHSNDIREYVITREGIKILPIEPSFAVPVLSMQQYSHVLTPYPVPREGAAEKARGPAARGRRPPNVDG